MGLRAKEFVGGILDPLVERISSPLRLCDYGLRIVLIPHLMA